MSSKEDRLTSIRGALQHFDVEPIWSERHVSSNLQEKLNRLNLLALTTSIDIYYGKLIKKHCS